jgi:uncharacterized protein YlzI (FlbEa/FlbD family)
MHLLQLNCTDDTREQGVTYVNPAQIVAIEARPDGCVVRTADGSSMPVAESADEVAESWREAMASV